MHLGSSIPVSATDSSQTSMPSFLETLAHLAFVTAPADGCIDVKFLNTFRNAEISLWGFEGVDQHRIDSMLRQVALRFYTVVDPDEVFRARDLKISIVDLGLIKKIDIAPQGVQVIWNATIDGCLMKKTIEADITKACVELLASNVIPSQPGVEQDQVNVICQSPSTWKEADATELVQQLLKDRRGRGESTLVQISIRNRGS